MFKMTMSLRLIDIVISIADIQLKIKAFVHKIPIATNNTHFLCTFLIKGLLSCVRKLLAETL